MFLLKKKYKIIKNISQRVVALWNSKRNKAINCKLKNCTYKLYFDAIIGVVQYSSVRIIFICL